MDRPEPLTKARRQELDWREVNEVTATFTQWVRLIAERHFREVGFELKTDRPPISDWFLCGVLLSADMKPYLASMEASQDGFLRGLFAEVFAFLMHAYENEPARPVAELLRAFLLENGWGVVLPPLLPPEAQGIVAEAKRLLAEVLRQATNELLWI